MHIKRLYLFVFLIIIIIKPDPSVSQNILTDTAAFPYWISMMQDPGANFFQTQRAFYIYWNKRKITKGSGWKVFKRWEYMMQSRINPDGSLPKGDVTYNAHQKFFTAKQLQYGNWVSLGPSTIPAPGPAGYEGLGRLNTIAFHPADPDKIYVGAPSGGFWYTSDGGITWVTTTDSLPTLGVSAIVVDYSNPDQILIGTGDRDADDAPGMGVFSSNDGGLSWFSAGSGMGNLSVRHMIQHPVNPLIILAATGGGVYRSVDGGISWSLSKVGDNPDIVYAAANTSFYRSEDNGITFIKITSGLAAGQRGVIGVSPANAAYVYFLLSDNTGGYQGLYRSEDEGLNFSARSTTPNIFDLTCNGSGTGGQGWYDLAIAVDPVNAEVLFAGGIDVWRSEDGGISWIINSHWWGNCSVPPVHADCHFLAFSPINGMLYACNDGGLFGTSDEGVTWPFFSETMTIGQIYRIGSSKTVKEKIISGFQDNGTYTLTANGWIQTAGGDGMECAIDATDAAYTYFSMYGGDIYRRFNNSGQAHIAGYGINGIDEYGDWVTPFILSKSNHRRMFAGYRNIWRCDDVLSADSIHFDKISDNLTVSNNYPMRVVEQSEADSNVLYAVRSDRKLFRSDNCLDANPVWTDLSPSWPSVLSGTSFASHPTDPAIVYLTAGSQVFKSTTMGASWTEITGNLPSIHINSIVCYKNAGEGLYVGTDAGVYYQDNSTGGWISFNKGLPANGRVTELEIFYDNDSVSQDLIRAATYGRGLWSSSMYNPSVTGIITPEPGFLVIYPNPTHGLFTIESRENFNNGTLSIYSGEGLMVFRKKLKQNHQQTNITIDTGSLAGGVYIIRLSGTNYIKTGKLVIY
ncbi:MAG: T9SS type A sorting domain-containing protein [Bacteroidetes bacterium]|nr:T9SS type A sorting domain-containing protein [Bacteroidota bacterium]